MKMCQIVNSISHGIEHGVEWWIYIDVDKVKIDVYQGKNSEHVVYDLLYPKGIFGKLNNVDRYRIQQITDKLIKKYKCEVK